ncbi:MAG: carbohydrate ABC transporter permease [Candidatus Rokuibacteriota bacterium]
MADSPGAAVSSGSGTAAPARRRRTLGQWLEQERVFRVLPLIPVQLLILTLLFVPFVLTIYISLLRWRLTRGFWTEAPWGGLSNFLDALTDGGFFDAIGRTFLFAGTAVVLELLIGFGLALLTYRSFRGRRFYFTVFLIPMMIIPVVVGYDFSMLLIDTGPLNSVLSALSGLEVRVRWMSDYRAAQAAVVLADVWQWTSLTFLIFVSGLVALPADPIRAAQVMGATRWQVFRYVQLPLLKPVIVIAVVIRAMEALKIFDMPMLLTQGGPGNATETISIYLFRNAWIFNKISYAAASSLILLVIFTALIYLSIWLLRRERTRLEAEATR